MSQYVQRGTIDSVAGHTRTENKHDVSKEVTVKSEENGSCVKKEKATIYTQILPKKKKGTDSTDLIRAGETVSIPGNLVSMDDELTFCIEDLPDESKPSTKPKTL